MRERRRGEEGGREREKGKERNVDIRGDKK